MKIKIVKTPETKGETRLQTPELIGLLKQLRPGLSFVVPTLDNQHRATITAIKLWTGRNFKTSSEKDSVRVSEDDGPAPSD